MSARDATLPGRPTRRLLWLAPVVIVFSVAPLFFVNEDLYWVIVGEDGIAEWATFAVYAVVAVLAVVVSRRLAATGLRLEAVLFVILALGAVFIAGEEASWFQRQLGFEGPEALVQRNLQGEANLHNVLGAVALHGSFMFVGAYGCLLARVLLPRVPRLRERPWLFVPPVSLAMWFALVLGYYGWVETVTAITGVIEPRYDIPTLTGPPKLQEVVELTLAGGFVLFLVGLVRSPDPSRGPYGVARSDDEERDDGQHHQPAAVASLRSANSRTVRPR